MQVEMKWQKPDRDEYCYVQGNDRIVCHVRPIGENGKWLYRQTPTNHLGYCDHPEWRELGDRLVCYIPGPPPEGDEQQGFEPFIVKMRGRGCNSDGRYFASIGKFTVNLMDSHGDRFDEYTEEHLPDLVDEFEFAPSDIPRLPEWIRKALA